VPQTPLQTPTRLPDACQTPARRLPDAARRGQTFQTPGLNCSAGDATMAPNALDAIDQLAHPGGGNLYGGHGHSDAMYATMLRAVRSASW
jgi:hypothetical protein